MRPGRATSVGGIDRGHRICGEAEGKTQRARVCVRLRVSEGAGESRVTEGVVVFRVLFCV